jgi:hypothetical protein
MPSFYAHTLNPILVLAVNDMPAKSDRINALFVLLTAVLHPVMQRSFQRRQTHH